MSTDAGAFEQPSYSSHSNEKDGVNAPNYDPSPQYNGDAEWEFHQPLPSILDPVVWYFTDFKQRTITYLISLFPVLQWIHRYNLKWLYGDLIAGITVGIVVVPQGMSYAQVAGLPVEYGLYSSFIGVMLYCFFATSKDVSIGPVAVMSSETYKITRRVLKDLPYLTEADLPKIAGILSLLCGGITFGLGLLRLGFILEYIPMPAVLGFMTGSAFTIAVGQVPKLMGINKLFNTRGASHLIVINTLKHLGSTDVNAAFGLVCLFFLYFLKFGCAYMEKRDKKRKIFWFYLGTLRAAFIVIFSTLISWGVYRIHGKTRIQMIKTVPRGLKQVGVHPVNSEIASKLAPDLPIATVILVLEHIAIAKSFGRINEYRVNPNQELVAIGISNLIGHFFQAYPNTGSFSRTALKSKCGVRTPLAGIFTGVCVLVAIYALTDAFYYISQAALAAIIIHAVGDLIASYHATYKFFLVAPVEFLIFIVDVFLCVFVTLEAGIYFSVAASIVNLLLKQTFPLGEFLGKVEFTREVVDIPEEPEPYLVDGQYPQVQNFKHKLLASKPVVSMKKFGTRVDGLLHKRHRHHSDVVDEGQSGADAYPQQNAYPQPSDSNYEKKQARSVNERSVGGDSSDESRDEIRDGSNDAAGGVGGEIFEEMVVPTGPGEPDHEYTKPVVLNPGAVTTKWWPLSHKNVHPGIKIVPPPPGIFVYRFRESLTYQNASWQTERIVDYMRKHTRRDMDYSAFQNQKLGDRPWNEPGPRKWTPPTEEDTRPVLRAIVFDMSSSPNVDLTGAQTLWDCHQELTKYACVPVEFHFAGILSPWSRRALVNCGFGGDRRTQPPQTDRLVELAVTNSDPESQVKPHIVPVIDTSNCYFHFDIPDLALRPYN